VKVSSGNQTKFQNSTSITTIVCGLAPNTEYSVCSQVLQLKGSNLVYGTPNFNHPITAKTSKMQLNLEERACGSLSWRVDSDALQSYYVLLNSGAL